MKYAVTLGVAMLALFIGCSTAVDRRAAELDAPRSNLPKAESFDDYWYPHGAELSRYALQQVRYGEVHPGDAVLVYVTEDFDPLAQVKYEGRSPDADGAVPILKLNMMKTFLTGIYPYSMMRSVFQPRDMAGYPQPLKVTTSSQEWCGHTWTQLNRRENGYRARQFSYFQQEGDTEVMLADAPSEASIWMLIRMAPERLPTGDFQMLPSTFYIRLSHRPIELLPATGELTDSERTGMNGEPLSRYTLTYADEGRVLSIWFWRDFPHVIEGWEEQNLAEKSTTKATRTHSVMQPYWRLNQPEHRELRGQLGLPTE